MITTRDRNLRRQMSYQAVTPPILLKCHHKRRHQYHRPLLKQLNILNLLPHQPGGRGREHIQQIGLANIDLRPKWHPRIRPKSTAAQQIQYIQLLQQRPVILVSPFVMTLK